MQRIKLLDSKTINQIAAGEVVESPRSVVKELTENAIDAGAASVTVEIKEGGISYIRVTDDGCGIPKEEVRSAFLRHATSKLNRIEDLEHIFTLGFRGEALASIAAVAQVELLTKTAAEETGTKICISGGEIESIEDVACREGTSVTVKNLFYNVPARRKFLKKPAAESGNVSDLLHKLALGHPEVAIRYLNNGATVLHTAGNGDAKAAIFYVYGKEAANQMLPLAYEKGEYAVSGWIGKPELSRANRNYENLFINGRFIKNKVVAAAVEDAYKTKLLIGKFPVFVLELSVAPALVDVNVHPAKLEVRFKNDDEVYDFFYTAVSDALASAVLIPRVTPEKKPTGRASLEAFPKPTQETLFVQPQAVTEEKMEKPKQEQKKEEGIPQKSTAKQTVPLPEKSVTGMGGGRSVDELLGRSSRPPVAEQAALPYSKEIQKQQEAVPMVQREKQPFFREYRIIGQVFRTYWIVEQADRLYLIDQHAAHERVLYEELMGRLQAEELVSQRLLTPLMLQLTPAEEVTLRENQGLLEGFGFGLEELGGHFALTAVPYLLREPDGIGFFTEILDRLAEERIRNVYDTKRMTVATMACKAAVKGHDVLSRTEAEALIHRLLGLEHPFTCPHGRPTIIEWSRYELEKMFKRIQN